MSVQFVKIMGNNSNGTMHSGSHGQKPGNLGEDNKAIPAHTMLCILIITWQAQDGLCTASQDSSSSNIVDSFDGVGVVT